MKLLQMCHFMPENVSIWSKFDHVKYQVILSELSHFSANILIFVLFHGPQHWKQRFITDLCSSTMKVLTTLHRLLIKATDISINQYG